MSTLVEIPYPIFTGTDGLPLENGYIFIGEVGLNPISNPKQAYWDVSLMIPAANIRTKAGTPALNGTPGRLYVDGNYSILVRDKQQRTVLSVLDAAREFTDLSILVENIYTQGILAWDAEQAYYAETSYVGHEGFVWKSLEGTGLAPNVGNSPTENPDKWLQVTSDQELNIGSSPTFVDLTLTGNLNLTGDLELDGSVTIGTDLTVDGSAILDDLQVLGSTTISSSGLTSSSSSIDLLKDTNISGELLVEESGTNTNIALVNNGATMRMRLDNSGTFSLRQAVSGTFQNSLQLFQTGNFVFSKDGATDNGTDLLQVGSDANASMLLGYLKLDSNNVYNRLAHSSLDYSTEYGVRLSNTGFIELNAISGQTVRITNNQTDIATFGASSIELKKATTIKDTSFDVLTIHRDQPSSGLGLVFKNNTTVLGRIEADHNSGNGGMLIKDKDSNSLASFYPTAINLYKDTTIDGTITADYIVTDGTGGINQRLQNTGGTQLFDWIMNDTNDVLGLYDRTNTNYRLAVNYNTGNVMLNSVIDNGAKLQVGGDTTISAVTAKDTLTLGRAGGQSSLRANNDNSGHLILDSYDSGGTLYLNLLSGGDVSIGGDTTINGTVTTDEQLVIEGGFYGKIVLDRTSNATVDHVYGLNVASTDAFQISNVTDTDVLASFSPTGIIMEKDTTITGSLSVSEGILPTLSVQGDSLAEATMFSNLASLVPTVGNELKANGSIYNNNTSRMWILSKVLRFSSTEIDVYAMDLTANTTTIETLTSTGTRTFKGSYTI